MSVRVNGPQLSDARSKRSTSSGANPIDRTDRGRCAVPKRAGCLVTLSRVARDGSLEYRFTTPLRTHASAHR